MLRSCDTGKRKKLGRNVNHKHTPIMHFYLIRTFRSCSMFVRRQWVKSWDHAIGMYLPTHLSKKRHLIDFRAKVTCIIYLFLCNYYVIFIYDYSRFFLLIASYIEKNRSADKNVVLIKKMP